MKDSDAQRLAENIQKLSITLAVTVTHVQHLTEEIGDISDALAEAAFTVGDIFKDLPPEVYKKLKSKKFDLSEGGVDMKKEGFVSLITKMLKGGKIK